MRDAFRRAMGRTRPVGRTIRGRCHAWGWVGALHCAMAVGVLMFALPGPESRLLGQEPAGPAEGPLARFEYEQVRFAAPVRLTFYASSEAVANALSKQVFDRLKHLDRVMSDYDPDSELSRLCATSAPGRPVKVGDELWTVLVESQRWAEATGGAFDISVAPVVKLWRTARRKKVLPTAQQQAAAMALVGYRSVRLDDSAKTVELLKPGMQLDLGGIAQGYAADEALRILKEGGVTRALVDVSGDIRVGDPPPGKMGWRVEVEAVKTKTDGKDAGPPQFVTLSNAAISTAGDAYQFTEIAGVRYSHIIDARTGKPMTQSCSVTVIASDASTADGLDTALCVLNEAAGKTLLESVPGARMFCVRVVDGEVRTVSSGWIP